MTTNTDAQPGEVTGIVAGDDRSGAVVRLKISDDGDVTEQLQDNVIASFHRAKWAARHLLASMLGTPLASTDPAWLPLQPSGLLRLDGDDDLADIGGPSFGLAWSLAITSAYLGVPLQPEVAASAGIEPTGRVIELRSESKLDSKFRLLERVYHRKARLLVAPGDYDDAGRPARWSAVETIKDAWLAAASGPKVARAIEHSPKAAVLSASVSDVLLDYFGGEDLALAIAAYLGWCASLASESGRAPDDAWESLVSPAFPQWVLDRGGPLDSVDRMVAAARGAKPQPTLEMPWRRAAARALRNPIGWRAPLDVNLFLRALWHRPDLSPATITAGDQREQFESNYLRFVFSEILYDKRRYEALRALSRTAPFGQSTDRQFRGVFSRVARSEVIPAAQVGSEASVHEGFGLINSTLGGAWLVPHALHYLTREEQLTKDDIDGFSVQPSNSDTYDTFEDGIRSSILNQGVFAIFIERPFSPRVLFEVLTGENVRYPAEKLLCRSWLTGLSQSIPELKWFWNYQFVPWVVDLRKQTFVYEEGAEHAVSSDLTAFGIIQVQDYAAFGRTNLDNEFLRSDRPAVTYRVAHHSQIIPSPSNPDSALNAVGWDSVRDSQGDWNGLVLDARAIALNASESLRTQMMINRWLQAQDPVEIPTAEFLAVPWASLPRVSGARGAADDALDILSKYLGAPFDAPARVGIGDFNESDFSPKFNDPYTWRGIGLATLWAYEAAIARALLDTLRRVASAFDSEDLRGFARRADVRLTLRLVEDYIRGAYVDELAHMAKIVTEVDRRLGGAAGIDELQLARARLEATCAVLRDEVDGSGSDRGG